MIIMLSIRLSENYFVYYLLDDTCINFFVNIYIFTQLKII